MLDQRLLPEEVQPVIPVLQENGFGSVRGFYEYFSLLRRQVVESVSMYMQFPLQTESVTVFCKTLLQIHKIPGNKYGKNLFLTDVSSITEGEINNRRKIIRDRFHALFPIIGSAHSDGSPFDISHRLEEYARFFHYFSTIESSPGCLSIMRDYDSEFNPGEKQV